MHSPLIPGASLVQSTPPAERLHRILYRMAERATAGLSLYDFLQTVHQLLGDLLYARNFYVCLVNTDRQTLDFPYYVDERDGDTMQCNDVPMRRGLTEYVLRTNRPQLIDAQRFGQLQALGEVTEATGDLSFSAWLGVPMQLRGSVGGVLVVQSYEAGVGYTTADADVLSFVANQFGSVLERHQAIAALKQSEARYRAVFEHLGVGVVVVQRGKTVFVNPAMVSILGRSMAELLSQPFTDCVPEEDLLPADTYPAQGGMGGAFAPFRAVRVVTGEGDIRHLEVSGADIDWNDGPATLWFAVDATARVLAEAARREALDRERELNDLKARFISMASHEFRTPLSTISGSADLLMHYARHLSADEQRDALQKIHNAVGRMTHMLENVLLTGQSEEGRLQFRPLPLAVAPFCRALVAEIHEALGQRNPSVSLQLDLPPDTECYPLDERLLRHVVGNLVSNAIKYSTHGGQVTLAVWPDGGYLRLSVADQGIGVAPQDVPRLFERFHRGSNVGHIAGTGLGLSIVKQAVTAHLGTVEVTSTLGQGTRFVVSLPAVRND